MGLLILILAVPSVLAACLLAILILRRLQLLRAERRRRATKDRMQSVAAALVVEGEPPPPLSPAHAELLGEVLQGFSRQITGSGRDRIAQYFEEVGLVGRQLVALNHKRAWRRARAAFILGDACSPRAIEPLIRCLDDPDRDVRMAAVRSLGKLRAVAASAAIVTAMAAGRVPYILAGTMLIAIGPAAAPPLRELCDRATPGIRAELLELVGILGNADDGKRLPAALADPAPIVRTQACLTAGRLGTTAAAARITELLDDPEEQVRAAAAAALGQLQNDAALPGLLRQARDDGFAAAHAAAVAAALIDPAAVLMAAQRPDAGPHLAEAADRLGLANR